MLPVDFEGAVEAKAPPGLEEQVDSLPVKFFQDENGNVSFVSMWLPSKEDIDAMLAGRGIMLQIHLPFVPILRMLTFDENGEIN
jgi:hypothetical protein